MITSKKRRAIAATTALLAAATVLSVSSASANVGTSKFEGNDGNTVVNTAGNKDWNGVGAEAAPNLTIQTDQQSGTTDNSFSGGSKEDDVDVAIGLGSIPQNKADLDKFGISSETLPNGNVMMYLAWSRVTLTGTTNFDFEINKLAQPDMTLLPGQPDRTIHLNRSVGDLLINYDLPPGGSPIPVLSIRTWTAAGEWSAVTNLNSGNSEGRINPAAVVFGGVTYPAAQFGEAAIDLTASGIIPNQNTPGAPCVGFGSAYAKSRASSSFSAQMKDYIAPAAINLNTCGAIKIVKVTNPASDTTTQFPFTLTGGVSNLNKSFNLVGGGFNLTTDAKAGSGYIAAETPVPAGWVLTSATCDHASTPANITVVKGETTTCTFTNTKQGTITVDKVTDPAGSPQEFDFTSSYDADGFVLTDAATPNASGFLAPGPYSVAETGETGWTLTSASCVGDDDGTNPATIVLDAGENVTCTFNNQARGHIIVTKQTDPADSPQSFNFTTTGTGYAGFSLVDNGINDSGELVPGAYSVAETTPDGWVQSSAVCTSSIVGQTETPGALDLNPGETINCLFTNTQGADITVTKTVQGFDPGQSFSFTSDFAVTPLSNGGSQTYPLAPNATYSVTEDGVLNWLLVNASPAGVTGQGGNVVCSDTSPSNAIALGAGEHVLCSFVNEWQVGAIRITKDAKHAASDTGTIPLAGVGFTIRDDNGGVVGALTGPDGSVCINNFAFGHFTVEEIVPNGYAPQAIQDVTIDSLSTCAGTPEVAAFHNVPLTNVTVSVNSQIDGGTASVVECRDTNGVVVPALSGSTDAIGDVTLTGLDLLPTDPAVTLTCTITIDP